MRIALGLDSSLDEFAHEHDAQTYREWGDDVWRRHLFRLAADPDTEIYWNLTGVDVGAGLLRAAAEVGGATDWELRLFRENPAWLSRCKWFRDGVEVTVPVDFEVHEEGEE